MASRQRVPEFFIVGHHKCGTSALWEMLRRHPQIYMPDVKETWYFSPELRSIGKKKRPAAGRPETLEQYLSLFADAGPDQRVGENSPAYLMSSTAAQRIAELQPDARIIAILREPASFLRSFHLQCLRNHVETEKDFGKAIALEADRREGRRIPRYSHRPHELLYSDHVRYVQQLLTYEACLPTRADPGAHLRGLPARQRGDGASGPAIPRRGRLRSDRADRGQSLAAACARRE